MKNIIKIILLILIPLVGVLFLSYPGVWKYRVENILNRKVLRHSGWKLSIGELSGHLFKQVNSKNIEIIHENGTIIYIPDLNAQFNVFKSLTGNLDLKELNIYDFYIQPIIQNNTENKLFILPNLNYSMFPLKAERIRIDGTLAVTLEDSIHFIDLNITHVSTPPRLFYVYHFKHRN